MESGNCVSLAEKVDIVTTILSELKYDALGLGQAEVSLGDAFYRVANEKKLTLVDAFPEARGGAVPYHIKTIDGVKVGIVSFGGVLPGKAPREIELRKARYAAYKAARDKSDILILLDQAHVVDQAWLERNTARMGAPDIVIGGTWASMMTEELVVGKTHIVPTGMAAKSLGVVDVTFEKGKDPLFAVRKIVLGADVEEDKAIVERLKADVESKTVKVVASLPESGTMDPPAPIISVSGAHAASNGPVSPGTYYSPTLCMQCHAKEYESWQATRHASAVQTLSSANKLTSECLPCHSEMYRKVKTVAVPADGIAGVECQTCHADCLPHDATRSKVAQKTTVSPKVCLTCHTKERSPEYNEKTYFPKVMHTMPMQTETASAR